MTPNGQECHLSCVPVTKVEVIQLPNNKSGAPQLWKRAREPPLFGSEGWGGAERTSNKLQGEATAAGPGTAPTSAAAGTHRGSTRL